MEASGKRRSCVGVTYYNAWLRTHGAPVCVGFSKQQEDNPVQSQAVFDSHVGPAGAAPNFKYWCVGYSMHADDGSNSMPYCEGLEVLMNQALKQHATSGPAGTPSGTSPVVTSLTAPPAAVGSAQAVAMQSHTAVPSSTQHAAQQQQQPDDHHHHDPASRGAAEEEMPAGPSLAKLYSTAKRNAELLQAGLRNEGPIALRPLPASWQEMGDRFWNTAARNGNNINAGAQRVARNMYASTIKPMAAILGLNRKS